jgi:hypothetical protein
MDHLSKEEDSQINREYLQSMRCTKEFYAPGASRANMVYDVDQLNKTNSAVRLFWCNLPLWPSDKGLPRWSLSLLPIQKI